MITPGELTDGHYGAIETEAAAQCVLQVLRDRARGVVLIAWGDPTGVHGNAGQYIRARIYILGDETVLMNWRWSFILGGGWGCQRVAVSQRVPLQPPGYFDGCLAAPDTATLIDCFTQGSTSEQPGPAGWLPPWTLGECDESLPRDCELP